MMENPWDKRYAKEEYVYGTSPNVYLKEKLAEIPKTGRILFPADGEGRNAVYAAELGWITESFDSSSEGKRKALALAKKRGVEIGYTLSEAGKANYPQASFDALALIYAHFPSNTRRTIHQHLAEFLKPGGYLILEAFHKTQIENQRNNPHAGGPPHLDFLYSLEALKEDFPDIDFKEARRAEVKLAEGKNHLGKGAVVRLFGVKGR